jgi:hypothetical protein
VSAYPVHAQRELAHRERSSDLADVLERVLDKGVVIAGDITIDLLRIELLTIRLRLLIASADKAREMGIDWWASDPNLSGDARELSEENKMLKERLDRMERMLAASSANGDGEGDRDPGDGDGRRRR